jgi:hypothetical protein
MDTMLQDARTCLLVSRTTLRLSNRFQQREGEAGGGWNWVAFTILLFI